MLTCYIFFSSSTEANILQQSSRQRLFLKHEFHYLHVPMIASGTAYDDFDCTLACLRNPMCLSVNMAAPNGSNENLWCELLSSDKYSSPYDYTENKSSHHFAIMVGFIDDFLIRFNYALKTKLLIAETTANHSFSMCQLFALISIQSPCSSTPCQNGGTCVASYRDDTFKCRCDVNFIGEFCEKGRYHYLYLCLNNKKKTFTACQDT